MDPIRTFVAGFIGRAAVEIVAMDELFRRNAPLPKRYHLWPFWLTRFFLAWIGGLLAVYYNIENPCGGSDWGVRTRNYQITGEVSETLRSTAGGLVRRGAVRFF
jgi:hypothetical protein